MSEATAADRQLYAAPGPIVRLWYASGGLGDFTVSTEPLGTPEETVIGVTFEHEGGEHFKAFPAPIIVEGWRLRVDGNRLVLGAKGG